MWKVESISKEGRPQLHTEAPERDKGIPKEEERKGRGMGVGGGERARALIA